MYMVTVSKVPGSRVKGEGGGSYTCSESTLILAEISDVFDIFFFETYKISS